MLNLNEFPTWEQIAAEMPPEELNNYPKDLVIATASSLITALAGSMVTGSYYAHQLRIGRISEKLIKDPNQGFDARQATADLAEEMFAELDVPRSWSHNNATKLRKLREYKHGGIFYYLRDVSRQGNLLKYANEAHAEARTAFAAATYCASSYVWDYCNVLLPWAEPKSGKFRYFGGNRLEHQYTWLKSYLGLMDHRVANFVNERVCLASSIHSQRKAFRSDFIFVMSYTLKSREEIMANVHVDTKDAQYEWSSYARTYLRVVEGIKKSQIDEHIPGYTCRMLQVKPFTHGRHTVDSWSVPVSNLDAHLFHSLRLRGSDYAGPPFDPEKSPEESKPPVPIKILQDRVDVLSIGEHASDLHRHMTNGHVLVLYEGNSNVT